MSANADRLPAAEIEARLDRWFEAEFSFRKSDAIAMALARLPRETQEFILDWARRAASTNIEVGYQFALHAPRALEVLKPKMIEAWVVSAMDAYDRAGLREALARVHDMECFADAGCVQAEGALFEEHHTVLAHFVNGLAGRRLKLKAGEHAYTDSETLHLPAVIARLPAGRDNFRLYKALATMLWAQTRFGTFRAGLLEAMETHPEPQRLAALFHALERERLEACIARELPGLHRELVTLRATLGEPEPPAGWRDLAAPLREAEVCSGDTLALALAHREITPPTSRLYPDELRPQEAAACMQRRIEKEKAEFRHLLRQIAEEAGFSGEEGEAPSPFEQRRVPDPGEPGGERIELYIDDALLAPPESVRALTTSIVQDLGELPPEYLVPAGPGEYDPALFEEREPDLSKLWAGTYHEEGAVMLDEWDYRRRHYRKGWCACREVSVTPLHDDFVEETRRKHAGVLRQLRKSFEALRDEDRVLRRQGEGDGIDIDALVEALADQRAGQESSPLLFTRLHRSERNIAVAFMVDMSGSTQGWINEAEREALVLLCEALESLGDRYAIYGFSSQSRKRCELFHIKGFDEPYDAGVRGRISAIRPVEYTRMGFAVRRLSQLLRAVDARTRVLVTLSDGKPDDMDGYRGDYGIEDTRRALVEARRDGIHPYCITIDEEARDYLPRLYGPAAYTVVDDVRRLPYKVSDIYRRLTT